MMAFYVSTKGLTRSNVYDSGR